MALQGEEKKKSCEESRCYAYSEEKYAVIDCYVGPIVINS
jgi:hypothetical protein